MLSTAEKLKFLTLGTKYKVNVINQVPGYIMLTVGTWALYVDGFIGLIEALKESVYIRDIVFDNAVVEIYYKYDILESSQALTTISAIITEHAP